MNLDEENRQITRQARLILNRVSCSRVLEEAQRLIDIFEGCGESGVCLVTAPLVQKAVLEGDGGVVFADLSRAVLQGLSAELAKAFRKSLHEQCELTFNRYLPGSAEEGAETEGIATFIARLYVCRVMSCRIVQSVLLHCLYGSKGPANCGAQHLPSPFSVTVIRCTLAICGSHLKQDPGTKPAVSHYPQVLEHLRERYPVAAQGEIDRIVTLDARGWPDTTPPPLPSRPVPDAHTEPPLPDAEAARRGGGEFGLVRR
eukprot:Rhum_TRINITY_DN15644_c0_g1::Rhum_TRINITY_DN15644_c0_g1_i1::g.161757::m.161757